MCDHDIVTLCEHDFNWHNNTVLELLLSCLCKFLAIVFFINIFVLTVSVISRDELARIGRYAGSAVLLAFCSEYGVTEIPEQQSSEGKKVPFETKIINVLKPTLDSEHEIITDEEVGNTPRKTLRQLLENDKAPHAIMSDGTLSFRPPKRVILRANDNLFQWCLIYFIIRYIKLTMW